MSSFLCNEMTSLLLLFPLSYKLLLQPFVLNSPYVVFFLLSQNRLRDNTEGT